MDIMSLKKTVLFRDMSEAEIAGALGALRAVEKKYEKSETILYAGDTTEQLGLVMRGSVTIENNDIWGNRTILSHVGPKEFFAESYAILADKPLMVDVKANEDSIILFLRVGNIQRIITTGQSWATKFVANLLRISTQKNLLLSGRSFHISPKTIRGRLMSYLNSMYLKTGSLTFDIPFDRQQLADYLNVERTALSKELGKMKSDGLIDYNKNHFTIISQDFLI